MMTQTPHPADPIATADYRYHDDDEPVSTTIALAFQDAVPAADGLPPLFESIDPEALDGLVDSARDSDLAVSFTHVHYRITVDPDGEIAITEAER